MLDWAICQHLVSKGMLINHDLQSATITPNVSSLLWQFSLQILAPIVLQLPFTAISFWFSHHFYGKKYEQSFVVIL